jgi:Uma2 family endonuclease
MAATFMDGSFCRVSGWIGPHPPEFFRQRRGMLLAQDDGRMSGMAERDVRAARVKLTYDDFVQFPDDGLRHELIDGEHYVSASPNTRHQILVGRLHLALGNWLAEHPVGTAFLAPYDVVFTTHDIVEPDLLFVSNQRASLITDLHTRGADLVVEVSSPATRRRDETIKRSLYERAGVMEYWFVDADADVIHQYQRDGVTFRQEPVRAGSGYTLTTPLLPGFELLLAPIFAR